LVVVRGNSIRALRMTLEDIDKEAIPVAWLLKVLVDKEQP
jgi:bisphosphoglycerate-dependent phosphoglycerate mutase